MIMTLVNLLATVIEVLLSVILMNSFFAPRFRNRIPGILIVTAASAALFALNFFYNVNFTLKTLIEVLLILTMLLIVYQGKLRDIGIFLALWAIGLSISNFFTNIAISLLPTAFTAQTDGTMFQPALRIILPKAFLMILVLLLSSFMKKSVLDMGLKYWLALLAVPLITLAIFTVFQYYIDAMPAGSRVIGAETTLTVAGETFTVPGLTIYGYILVAIIGLAFINVLVFALFARFRADAELIGQYELQQKQTEMQSRSIEQLEDSYSRMRALRHDLQNKLVVLNTLAENEQYDELRGCIKTMTNEIDEAAFMTISRQSAVDAILNEKLAAARRLHIATQFDVAPLTELFVEPMDLCIILANILDNALEACAKLPDEADRYIRLKIAQREQYLVVSSENAVLNAPVSKNGSFVTDKPDAQNHGFGIRSIRETAKKYNGESMIRCVDHVFTIIVKLNKRSDQHEV